MPSTIDTESQFKFLIACIKHSSNGKVDFEEVRKECGIVSKGAAAKRYERLMRTHGIGGLQGTPKKEPKEGGSSSTPSKASRGTKRRKLKEVDEDAGDIDEPIKGEVKREVKSELASNVKTELGLGCLASLPSASEHQPSQAPSDDDDEVLIVSATERPPSAYGSERAHSHSPAPHIVMPTMHAFDYATNMFSSHQMSSAMARPSLPRPGHGHPLPYGFPANPTWYHPQQHQHHGSTSAYYWPSMALPSPEGHQHEEHHNA